MNGALGIIQTLEPGTGIANDPHSQLFAEPLTEPLPDGPVEDSIRMFKIAEEEGEIECSRSPTLILGPVDSI